MMLIKRFALSICLLICLGFISESASAQERLCDTSFEDCRQPLWTLIDSEQVGIDVAFWFMQDTSMSNKIIARFNAGVRVRILVDPRANPTYAGNEAILNQLRNAGIPMRYKVGGGILHWKMMLFEGQNKLEFSGANYGPFFFVPNIPYQDYIDEAIYFTDDPSVVNSFKTKYDDLWTDTVNYADYGNITGPLTRRYPTFPIDPALNFPPSADGSEDFYNRTAFQLNQENQKIDIIMYRHTNDRYTDRTVAARARGVPVRMITEQQEYRNTARQWDAYNIDLLYNAGVQIRIRNHQGLNHEKVVMLYGQGMTIFGSSNWTGPSSNSQQEHNYFTTKQWIFNWFVTHFERKWNSTETQPFTPLPPDAPSLISPGNGATGQPTTNMALTFEGGPWAHKFDIYFGTDPNPPLIATDQFLGRVDDGVVERYTLPQTLMAGTTYYWRIVSKTMANVTATGPVWRFTTAGTPPNPAPAPTVSSISPATGPTGGGTSVTITGANFQTGATVRIGGTSATSVNVVNSTTITALTPSHAAGTVDVVVTNTDTQSGTLANGFTYTAPQPPPETVLLQDDFNDNSLNTSKWTANNLFSGFTDANVPVAEAAQRIEFGPLLQNVSGSHYNGIRSASTFDFTNGYAYVEIVQPSAANTAADAMFTLGNTVDNYYRIYVEGGTLFLQKRINTAKTTLLSAPFNAVNDRYWRIRHDAANSRVIFETAPDNAGVPGAWTQRHSEPWAASVNLAAVQFELKGGTWQIEANAPGKVIFDNFKAARP